MARARNGDLSTAPAITARRREAFRRALLGWYEDHARDLPWRTGPAAHARGERPDPYRVWLSEIMLQQTTVAAVAPRYRAFLARWPSVADLAAASLDEVRGEWAGLGYYRRAANLHACAQVVAGAHGGRFPDDETALRALPGVGAYTAAAVAAIAFDRAANVVDGNVERVMARLHRVAEPLPAAKKALTALAGAYVAADRPGCYAQALMDLGATVCAPAAPDCLSCPVSAHCAAHEAGDPHRFPIRALKKARPMRRGAVFIARDGAGRYLLRRRPESGMLAGMVEFPSTGWSAKADGATGPEAAPIEADWKHLGAIEHVFTHFALTLIVYAARHRGPAPEGCFWAAPEDLPALGLPSLMNKALRLA